MYECLKGFEVGNVNLRVLISSLRGLINVLQEPEDEWKTSFLCEWWTLEEIYSLELQKKAVPPESVFCLFATETFTEDFSVVLSYLKTLMYLKYLMEISC